MEIYHMYIFMHIRAGQVEILNPHSHFRKESLWWKYVIFLYVCIYICIYVVVKSILNPLSHFRKGSMEWKYVVCIFILKICVYVYSY